MLGAATARAASFNVNYRYVEAELAYLLDDASARAIIYHVRFAPILGTVLGTLREPPKLLLQVADESGHALLPGALDYEEALSASTADAPRLRLDADDLYVVYTGGTTGMPKGILWAQASIIESALANFLPEGILAAASLDEGVAAVVASDRRVLMPLPPLMHAAAIVELAPGRKATDTELLAHAGRSHARYKLPKAILRIETLFRSSNGKADYGWARKIPAESVAA